MTDPKSCYILELSIQPGGGRFANIFVENNLDAIRRHLEETFLSDDARTRGDAAYYALWYGETIALWTVKEGRVIDGLDLHPHLRVKYKTIGPVHLADSEGVAPIRAAYGEVDSLLSGEDFTFFIDWPEIEARMKPLEGALLQPGERMPLFPDQQVMQAFETYLDTEDSVGHGLSDLENGDYDVPPDEDEDD